MSEERRRRAPVDLLGDPLLQHRLGILAGALGAVLAGAGVLAAGQRLTRLEIEGLSMVPALGPGDRVLVLRTDRVAVGDVVAFKDPEGGETLVKRVTGIERGSVRVEGDNLGPSRDSRHFGPVPRSAIVGRVLWCYWSPYHPRPPG